MRAMAILLLLGSVAITGCQFDAGAATGALATGAGYEYNSKRQMDRLEDDYRNERISRSEYERRKSQIERWLNRLLTGVKTRRVLQALFMT